MESEILRENSEKVEKIVRKKKRYKKSKNEFFFKIALCNEFYRTFSVVLLLIFMFISPIFFLSKFKSLEKPSCRPNMWEIPNVLKEISAMRLS